MDLAAWIAAEGTSSPLEHHLHVTEKALTLLWDRRPAAGLPSSCVEQAGQLVRDTARKTTGAYAFLKDLAPEFLLLDIEAVHVQLTPRAGLLVTCTATTTGPTVSLDEGFVRLAHTLVSLALWESLTRLDSDQPGDGFITASFYGTNTDAELISRLVDAIRGNVHLSGGYYLPIVPLHTSVSERRAHWLLTGLMFGAIVHELAHLAYAREGKRKRQKKRIQRANEGPQWNEAFCDMTATVATMGTGIDLFPDVQGRAPLSEAQRIALFPDVERSALFLAGTRLLPRFLDLVDDLRFAVPPSTHPTAATRVELLDKVYEDHLPPRLLQVVSAIAQESTGSIGFEAVFRSGSELGAYRKWPEHHLANCLHPRGPIQFRVATTTDATTDEGLSSPEFEVVSTVLSRGEETARQRTLPSFALLANIGRTLCVSPETLLTSPLARDLARELLIHPFARSQESIDSGGGKDQEAFETSLVLATIGQHFFFTEFAARVAPDLLANDTILTHHGISLDLIMSRYSARFGPDIALWGTICFERSRKGEYIGFDVDEEKAAALYSLAIQNG